jgi:cell division septation protein DedD
MAGREEGEFELILGNKQLLSVLLLVVILLGVFFAMGYLAGRSTSAGPTLAGTSKPLERTAEKPTEKTPEKPPPAADPIPAKVADPEPPPRVVPARETPPKPATETRPPASTGGAEPPDGRYLQASALARSQAEAMLKLFAKDGMTGYLALSPKRTPDSPELYRVLIGPLADAAAIAKTRAYLKDKGIEKPLPRTYPDASHSN